MNGRKGRLERRVFRIDGSKRLPQRWFPQVRDGLTFAGVGFVGYSTPLLEGLPVLTANTIPLHLQSGVILIHLIPMANIY